MKKAILPYLLLFGAVVLCFSQDVTIFPGRPSPVVVPSIRFELMTGVPLICGLEPETLTPGVNYTTRWTLPGGEIVSFTTGRYIISEGLVSINSRNVPGTILLITMLSYQDAGLYTCEGRSTAPGASTEWARANFELQLTLELLSNTTTTMATTDDSTVALHCEMRAYILPDNFLIWEGPGGRRISGGTGKHQIAFSDGSPEAAANGIGILVPSRVSTLTITNPEPSDAGTYTCTVMDTSEAVTMELMVNGSTMSQLPTTNSTPPHPNITLLLTGIILGCVTALTGLLVTGTAIMYCLISLSRRNKTREPNNDATQSSALNPVHDYDYISLEPDQHNGQPGINEVKGDDLSVSVNSSQRHDNLNTTMANVDTDVNDDSDVNVAYGVIVDGVSAALEVNVAYGAVDTVVMEENEAYGAAIDGIGVDIMERNVAYGTNRDCI